MRGRVFGPCRYIVRAPHRHLVRAPAQPAGGQQRAGHLRRHLPAGWPRPQLLPLHPADPAPPAHAAGLCDRRHYCSAHVRALSMTYARNWMLCFSIWHRPVHVQSSWIINSTALRHICARLIKLLAMLRADLSLLPLSACVRCKICACVVCCVSFGCRPALLGAPVCLA